MKKLIVLPLALGLLIGCSSNTPYVDKEFGKATRMAFDGQIADQTYRHADQVPEGIAGLPAENIMKVYTEEFGKTAEAEAVPMTFKSGGSSSSSSSGSN
jgi:hypothetical protein